MLGAAVFQPAPGVTSGLLSSGRLPAPGVFSWSVSEGLACGPAGGMSLAFEGVLSVGFGFCCCVMGVLLMTGKRREGGEVPRPRKVQTGAEPSAAGSRFFLFTVHIASDPFEKQEETDADDDERNEGFKTGHDSLFLPPAINLPAWKKRVICGISSVLFGNCRPRPAV